MKLSKSVYMFIVLFLLIAAAVFYLSRRTAFVFGAKPTWFYVAYSILLLSSFFIMAAAMRWRSAGMFAHIVVTSNAVVLGILLNLLMCALVVDLVQLFAHFNPKTFGMTVAVLTLVISGYSLWNATDPHIQTVEIPMRHLKQPTNMVQLADIHLGQFRGRNFLQNVVNKVNTMDDISGVVITGDLFDSHYNYDLATLEPLKQLKVPVYFVDGNHDIYIDDAGIKEKLRKIGVCVLENETAVCGELQIVGLNYMRPDRLSSDMMHVPLGDETMETIIPKMKIDSTLPAILLHHNPVGAKYAAENGIDLYLSGHTHGGQLFPITLVNDVIFEYNKGLHLYENMYIYVSEGLGTFGLPMRLGTHSEITKIRMLPTSKK